MQKEKTKLGCSFRLNSFWTLWYCAVILAVELYLVYLAAVRYQTFKNLKWTANEQPELEYTAYVALITISVLCMPMFVVSTIFKVDNYANDGVKLGGNILSRKEIRSQFLHTRTGKKLWRHLGPTSQILHVIAAFCLLLPHVLLQAQEIKHGYLVKEHIWETDLDVMFGKSRINILLYEGHNATTANRTDITPVTNLSTNSTTVAPIGVNWKHKSSPSLEFINFGIALLMYTIRYPAVFWFAHKTFTLIFSLQLLLMTIVHLLSYCGFAVIYKLQVNQYFYSGIDVSLKSGGTAVAYIFGNSLIFFSSVAIFKYGYQFYQEQFLRMHRQCHAFLRSEQSETCHGYVPHTAAMLLMVLSAACKGPIVYEYVRVYRRTGDSLILTCIIVDAVYMAYWMILWFIFTIKHGWQFKIRTHQPKNQSSNIFTIQNSQTESSLNSRASSQRENAGQDMDSSVDTEHDTADAEVTVAMATGTTDQVSEATDSNRNTPQEGEEAQHQTGALRKKLKQRKVTNKVTFEDTIVPNGNLPDNVAPQKPPRVHQLQRAHNSHGQQPTMEQISVEALIHDQRPMHSNNFQRSSMRGSNRSSGRRHSIAESSPENTLKRDYRSSVRKQCGHYCNYDKRQSLPSSVQTTQLNAENEELDIHDISPEIGYTKYDKVHHNDQSPLIQKHKNSDRTGLVYSPFKRTPVLQPNLMPMGNTNLGGDYVEMDPSGNPHLLHPNGKPGFDYREIQIVPKKAGLGRRDSANFSLTSSQETSSNNSDNVAALCSQV